MQLVYFIVLVGVLIFVHELGHFAWAKIFRVKVLKFSLGFGPKLLSVRRGETEYVVAMVPLGGFVRMLGEDPNEVVGPQDEGRAFHQQPLWRRFVIVFAGPAMNLAFPLLLLFVVFLSYSELPAPSVGRVIPGMPAAAAGLEPGDRIREIDGAPVASFDELQRIVSEGIGRELVLEVEREGEDAPRRIRVRPRTQIDRKALGITERVGRIGVVAYSPAAVVGIADPRGPAAAAGLETFDLVTSVDERPIRHWPDFERTLERTRGEPIRLSYLRGRPVNLGFATIEALAPGEARIVPDPALEGPRSVGLELAEMYVATIDPGSPEYRMGLRRGDRIDEVDGKKVVLWREQLADWLVASSDRTHRVEFTRAGRPLEGSFKMHRESRYDEEAGREVRKYVFHTANWIPTRMDDPVPNEDRLAFAARNAFHQTGEVIHFMLTGLLRMAQGRLSFKTVGGPMMLYDIAGQAAERGALDFLFVMALISINLGILNLLPIPVLDGGHLLFIAVESLTRRPVSLRTREIASMVGLSMLVLLMVFAFKNDIERYWDSISGFFSDLGG
ncbi:MAG: RIP metalloprotease RseP [Deltaproteobacteria bacterium]|nr:RIP metalloprotease RseP [Deltaproteobacteria bacterium]